MSENTWSDEALCLNVSGDVFFVRSLEKKAKSVCAKCPVIEDCFNTALNNSELYGVWGGAQFTEKRTTHARELPTKRLNRLHEEHQTTKGRTNGILSASI